MQLSLVDRVLHGLKHALLEELCFVPNVIATSRPNGFHHLTIQITRMEHGDAHIHVITLPLCELVTTYIICVIHMVVDVIGTRRVATGGRGGVRASSRVCLLRAHIWGLLANLAAAPALPSVEHPQVMPGFMCRRLPVIVPRLCATDHRVWVHSHSVNEGVLWSVKAEGGIPQNASAHPGNVPIKDIGGINRKAILHKGTSDHPCIRP